MPTTIEGASVVMGGFRRRHSALRLAVAASRAALERSGLARREVDLLINAGIYRDRILGEPALAPLIQDDAGLDSGDPQPGGSGTFSFDVSNGPCGVLNALQIADGFLRSATIRAALVVASDADPGRGLAPHFPFRPVGAAAVCRWTGEERGLIGFAWRDVPDGGSSFRSTVTFDDGSNTLAVVEEPAFAEAAGEAAGAAAAEVLERHGASVATIDLVVAAPARPLFVKVLAEAVGLGEEWIVTGEAGAHTAGLLAALEKAERSGLTRPGGLVLLVCGGAGVTAGAALYRI